jgi:hypothetical protein
MLLTLDTLARIQAAEVDLAYRLWRKPTVKPGGRLRTAIGELAIGAVDVVEAASITDREAQRAGFADADSLRADLFRPRPARGRTAKPDESSRLFRIEVTYAGPDTRAALREALLGPDELSAVVDRLAAMDARATGGPWVVRHLRLIATWPGRRAPELAEMEGQETARFKATVRRLKELGLTESLPVGYRLSSRGEQVLRALDQH